MTHTRRKRLIALLCALVGAITAAVPIITAGEEGQILATGHRPTALLLDHAAGRLLVSQAGRIAGAGDAVVSIFNSHSGQLLAQVGAQGSPEVVAWSLDRRGAVIEDTSRGSLLLVDSYGHAHGPVAPRPVVPDAENSTSVADTALFPGVRAGPASLRIVSGSLYWTAADQEPRLIALPMVPLTLIADPSARRVLVFGSRDAGLPEAFGGPGVCSVIDTRTGKVQRTLSVGTGPWHPALDRHLHRAFVANAGSGTVTIIDSRTGRIVRTIDVGDHPAAVAVDERHHRVFVALQGTQVCPALSRCSGTDWAGDGQVVALTADGVRLHSWRTGGIPFAVAADDATGHVFVLDSGGAMHHPPSWLPGWLGRWWPESTKPAPGRVIMLSST